MTKEFSLFNLLKLEHFFKIGSSLYVIGTSIYDLQEDVLALKKEHGLLLIGLFTLGKVSFELFQKVKEMKEDLKL